jgi:hypothetical protein
LKLNPRSIVILEAGLERLHYFHFSPSQERLKELRYGPVSEQPFTLFDEEMKVLSWNTIEAT